MKTLDTPYPERIIPDETEPGVVSLHLKRYDFALPYCKDKAVLDIACGVGYGAAYLGREAKSVVGVEIDASAIAYAENHYASQKVQFHRMDAAKLAFPDSSFDVICSFETIEHVNDAEKYLSEMVRVLQGDGIYFVSTPHVKKTTHRPKNPFHRIEYSRKDFEILLLRYFGKVELYGQRRKQSLTHHLLQKLDVFNLRSKLVPAFIVRQSAKALGTTPIAELSLDDILISKEKLFMATEMVAICRQPLKS